jgi:hypothetical protein
MFKSRELAVTPRPSASVRCGFCHGDLESRWLSICGRCRAPHHHDCWGLAQGCAACAHTQRVTPWRFSVASGLGALGLALGLAVAGVALPWSGVGAASLMILLIGREWFVRRAARRFEPSPEEREAARRNRDSGVARLEARRRSMATILAAPSPSPGAATRDSPVWASGSLRAEERSARADERQRTAEAKALYRGEPTLPRDPVAAEEPIAPPHVDISREQRDFFERPRDRSGVVDQELGG